MMRESMAMTDVMLKERVKDKNGWISADEKLPTTGDQFLVYCVGCNELSKDRREFSVMRFDAKNNKWRDISPIFKVTHWQSLPEPPQLQEFI